MDVTEAKLAKDALEHSGTLLSSIINSPENIIIFALDTSYNYLGFNTAHANTMKEVYGADIEIGGHVLDYMPSSEDRLLAEENYERVLKGERFIVMPSHTGASSTKGHSSSRNRSRWTV